MRAGPAGHAGLQPGDVGDGPPLHRQLGTGGTADTHEMLAFCQRHGIVAEVEVIAMEQINATFARLAKGDVHYRFAIDMARSPL